VSSEEERLTLNTLLASSVESQRREFVFNADVASLLVGDFATESIESQSLKLLRGLTYFQRHDKLVGFQRALPSMRVSVELTHEAANKTCHSLCRLRSRGADSQECVYH
jgi:hypothetical protein